MNLGQVAELARGALEAKRNELHPVVNKSGHCSDSGRLLSSTETSSGNEQASRLAVEGTGGPKLAGGIEEGLQRRRRFHGRLFGKR